MDELGFSPQEWAQFSRIEKRIIIMSRKYEMEPEAIKANLTWPLDPLKEVTFRGHKARLMKKMSKIRLNRQSNPSQTATRTQTPRN